MRTLLLFCPLLTFFGSWVCLYSNWFVMSNLIRTAMLPFKHPGSVVLPPITVTQFLSYSFICAVGTPALENARKCQSNTTKYVIVKYLTPHKVRTLIPTANDIEIFQNHISSYGFHFPSFLIGVVGVSNKKSIIYHCSCCLLTHVSPNHNFQSCLLFC